MVLVSHKAEFIFLKTRKTAGTSIEMALQGACMPPGREVGEATEAIVSDVGIVGSRMINPKRSANPSLAERWNNHRSAQRVLLYLGPYKFVRYRKISAVRNPFTRCVSLFYWYGSRGELKIGEDLSSTCASFREFICTSNWPDDRKIVSIAGQNVIDEFVRFESLRSDLERLAQRLSIRIDLDALPHTKKSSRSGSGPTIEELYDARSIDVVRRRMKWVFDRFDYADTPSSEARGE